MSYNIQFIGLVCFFDPGKGSVALLPDGRKSSPPHTSRIAIDKPKSEVLSSSGNWPDTNGEVKKGDFLLDEPCEIELSGVDVTTGKLNTSEHGIRLAKLTDSNRKFRIDLTKAITIARVTITNGTLKERRYPGTKKDDQHASLISELTVPHNGDIEITVRLKSGTTRSITLKKGTEVAILNEPSKRGSLSKSWLSLLIAKLLRPKRAVKAGMDHFHIYEQLGNGEALGTTPLTKTGATRSDSRHRAFKPGPIVDGVRCPNTGCCS
ncbi:MAG TPA: hypothetical protein VN181_07780 [Thermoanaerobaculia bacterium]|nr:hypothetical protein [Thermoanaerobaculia bacterium]